MSQHTPDDPITAEIKSLQKPLSGRRLFSWLFFLLALVLFLLVPATASRWPAWYADNFPGAKADNVKPAIGSRHAIALRTSTTASGSPAAAAPLSTFMSADRTWNPGTVASSHQPWANDCKACHSTPFARVKDTDCLVCHNKVGDHVDAKLGKVHGLSDVRCATCHRDHQGEFGLTEQNKRFTGENCASCHADIKSSLAKTETGNVRDFAKEHPQFRVQLATKSDASALTRVRQGPGIKMKEQTGLKFPHDVHLTAGGVRSPTGKVDMDCATCHKPNADQTGFKPVTMKADCQSCHELKFEPAVSNRKVPHGSVEEVLTTLREFYSYVSVNQVKVDARPVQGSVFQLRPGKEAPMSSFVKAPGDVRSRTIAAATELFERTSCMVCHDVTRSTEPGKKGTPSEDLPQWKIAPVTASHAWMPKAEFSHAKHQSAQCTDCHAAGTSKAATDVLMPEIKVCRDCHAGKEPVIDKVTSDCGLCHGFHMPEKSNVALAGKRHALSTVTKP